MYTSTCLFQTRFIWLETKFIVRDFFYKYILTIILSSGFYLLRFADVFRQSSLVFTEQTGLQNLHTIISYCIDQSTCKRTQIANHFNEITWPTYGNCNEMCDNCLNKDKISMEQINCINEARSIIEILNMNSLKAKEKRLTANKLLEMASTELKKKNLELTLIPSDIEKLILNMLMTGYLKEEFHFTPYNTICYIVKGPLSDYLCQEEMVFSFTINTNQMEYKTLKRKLGLTNQETEQYHQIEEKKPKFFLDNKTDVITITDGSDDGFKF